MSPTQHRLFLGCLCALGTTAFGFILRALALEDWMLLYNLSGYQVGQILGAGLYPFAFTILLWGFLLNWLGYRFSLALALGLHLGSAVWTIQANDFGGLYWSTFMFALANGIIEAVVNPLTTTMETREKASRLVLVHTGWPGGLACGGLLILAMGRLNLDLTWKLKYCLLFVPTVAYGLLFFGRRLQFPPLDGEGRGAWLNSKEMLKAMACPLFFFLSVLMMLLSITELSTDGWIANLMTGVVNRWDAGALVLIYTSILMLLLRLFGSRWVRRFTAVRLLVGGSVLAATGLYVLSRAGSQPAIIFLAATLFGLGKAFFWPGTLGLAAERLPQGGPLALSGLAGIGMLSAGLVGTPLIGTLLDRKLDDVLLREKPALHFKVMRPKDSVVGTYNALDQELVLSLPARGEDQAVLGRVIRYCRQGVLGQIALLPAAMVIGYLGIGLMYGWGRRKPGDPEGEPPPGNSMQA